MKKRQIIHTFEAKEIQHQINECKHDRARKLLDSRLRSTYMDSYVDLERKKATVLIMKDYLSAKAKEHLKYDIFFMHCYITGGT
jgi:hypothetical protein